MFRHFEYIGSWHMRIFSFRGFSSSRIFSLRPTPAHRVLRRLFTGLTAAFLLTLAANVTQAEPTAFGADVVEKNGPVDGYGVVWALEVAAITPASTAEAAGLQPGDIIVNIQRHNDKLYSSGGQSDMVKLLTTATYKDSYKLSILRPGAGGAAPPDLSIVRDFGTDCCLIQERDWLIWLV